MKRVLICLLLLFLAGLCLADTYYVRQPIQITDDGANEYYDRGMDITFGNGYYWLVYGKCDNTDAPSDFEGITTENYYIGSGANCTLRENIGGTGVGASDGDDLAAMVGPCGPDVYYKIYYKKAISIEALADATEQQLLINGNQPITNVNMGEVYCEFYDNKIFVFTTQGGGTDITGDYNQLYYTVNGTTWYGVGEIFDHDPDNDPSTHTGERGRYDFTVYNGELWAITGNRLVVHTNNPTDPQAWQTAIETANVDTFNTKSTFEQYGLNPNSIDNAPKRFFVDPNDNNLYIIVSPSNFYTMIYVYNETETVTEFVYFTLLKMIADYPSIAYDPYNSTYIVLLAPSSFYLREDVLSKGRFEGQHYFIYWAESSMSGFNCPMNQVYPDPDPIGQGDDPGNLGDYWKILDPAQYPVTEDNNPWNLNTWVDYNSQLFVDDQGGNSSGKTYFFFSSQRKTDDPTNGQQSGDIYCLPFDWNSLETHHFNFISSAFSEVRVRRYSPNVSSSITNIKSYVGDNDPPYADLIWSQDIENQIVYLDPDYFHNTYFVHDGLAEDDILELMSGVYTENVTVNANATIDGNKVAEINPPDRGYSFVISSNCTIRECIIMDGIDNTGNHTVNAGYNYWGSPDGPQAGDIVGNNVNYVPYYTDMAMTDLGPVISDLNLTYTGTQATLTWTQDANLTYKIYATNDPSEAMPWSEELSSDASSGTQYTTNYQYFALVTESWNDGAVKIGYSEHTLTKGTTTGYNYVSICLDYGVSNNSELAELLNLDTGETINYWDNSLQSWTSTTVNHHIPEARDDEETWTCDPEIPLVIGDIVNVNVNETNSTMYLTGEFPNQFASFDFMTTSTTNMNLAFIPLNQYQADNITITELGNSIGTSNANTISYWDETNQAWWTACYIPDLGFWTFGDETISIGDAIMVGALQNFTWPSR